MTSGLEFKKNPVSEQEIKEDYLAAMLQLNYPDELVVHPTFASLSLVSVELGRDYTKGEKVYFMFDLPQLTKFISALEEARLNIARRLHQ